MSSALMKKTFGDFRLYIKEPYGMVLVTGPTGSGKTTTLYAALNEIRNDEDKIITIEDPVEYQLHGIVQIPVNEKKGLTFARGLRSILRHDPDKIMVGEIRDEETAQIAIQSALTGHLVFTTVHANNVIDVIGRFLNMGVEPYNFVSSLNCVLAQRLVRLLVPDLQAAVSADRRRACSNPACGRDDIATGYFYPQRRLRCLQPHRLSRTNGDPRASRYVRHDPRNDHRTPPRFRDPPAGRKRRLSSLRESAVKKVFAGMTTLYEINRVTFVEEVR